MADPAYATVVGILLKGAEQGGCSFVERPVAPVTTTTVPHSVPAAEPHRPGAAVPRQPGTPTAPRFGTPSVPHPVPPRPVHEPTPVEPAPQPADEEPSEEPKPATPVAEPRRKRDWGSIFQKAIDKINGSFTHAEDEEI